MTQPARPFPPKLPHPLSEPTHPVPEPERASLGAVAQDILGAAQLLGTVAQAETLPPALRSGLELLSRMLIRTADNAASLIEEIGFDITDHLGVTTADLARIAFTPVEPPFHRHPGTLDGWTGRAQAEFMLWGAVEAILAEDDAGLERRFNENTDEHLMMVDALEKLRERWQSDIKLLEATLLRLAVVVARWEQASER